MVNNNNNAGVPEPTPVVQQPIPTAVMIPEHNTDTGELLDADDTTGGDNEPFPKHGQGGTIRHGKSRCVCTCGGRHGHGIRTHGSRGKWYSQTR